MDHASSGKRKRSGIDTTPPIGINGKRLPPPPPKDNAQAQHQPGQSSSSSLPDPAPRLDAIPAMVTNLANIIGLPFEDKQRLQSLVRHAYGQITDEEMENDRSDFERRIQCLQRRLGERRDTISRLLDVPLLRQAQQGGDNRNNERIAAASSSDIGGAQTRVSKGESSSGGAEGDPFGETILLLRHETPKLEQRVSRQIMMMIRGIKNQPSSSPLSTIDVQGGVSPTTSDEDIVTKQTRNGDRGLTSIVDIEHDNASSPPSASTCKRGYRLASRILQEGGEEIEIFEKCVGDGN